MELTRIEEENREAFSAFIPAGLQEEGDLAVGVLSEEELPIAAALFSPTENGVMLKWIFTDPDERRKGAAMLILHDAMILLKGQVKALTVSYDENTEGLGELLEHMGFTITEGDPAYSIQLKDLLKVPAFGRLPGKEFPHQRLLLSEASPRTMNGLRDLLNREAGGTVFLEDIDRDLSLVTETEEGKVLGALLVKRLGKDLQIKLIVNKNPGRVEQLFQGLVEICLDESLGNRLCFVATNPSVEEFIDQKISERRDYKTHLRYAVAAF